MHKRVYNSLFLFTCLIALVDLKLYAQHILLPLDSAVRMGTLANGFRYYIRENKDNTGKIAVRFVVKSGYMEEDDDQIELSHLLEHVSLSGTTNFPEGAEHYFTQCGALWGKDVNAYTGYLSTIYKFDVPGDSAGAVMLAMRIARDIATEVAFDTSVVRKERLAVIAEKKQFGDLSSRELQRVIPTLFGKSRFGQRGIGTNWFPCVANSSDEALKRYYRDWYRPDLQAIVIVGDVDVNLLEAEVNRLFSSIPKARSPRAQMRGDIFSQSAGQFTTDLDADRNAISVVWYAKFREPGVRMYNDLRRRLIQELFADMLSQRSAELQICGSSGSKEFVSAYIVDGINHLQGVNTLETRVSAQFAREIKPKVIAALKELRRIEKFGFTKHEFEQSVLHVSAKVNRFQSKNPNSYTEDYISHFIYGDHFLSPDRKKDISLSMLGKLSLSEVNAFASELLRDIQKDVFIFAPKSKQDSLPSKLQWNEFEQESKKEKIKPFEHKLIKQYKPKVKRFSDSTSIMSEQNALGVTELTLRNGVKIVLKTTAGRGGNQHISIYGISTAGASRYSGDNYYSAIYSASIVFGSRIDNLSASEVSDFMADRNMRLEAYVHNFSSGVKGNCSIEDLDVLVAMIRRRFEKPVKDKAAFLNWISLASQFSSGRTANSAFLDTIRRLVPQDVPQMTYADLRKVDFDDMYNIYEHLFSNNAGNFTFIITGDFDPKIVLPIVVKHLGTLKSSKKGNTEINNFPKNSVDGKSYRFQNGGGNFASVELRLAGDIEYSVSNSFALNFLKWFIQKRLMTRLREKEGGIYSVKTSVEIMRSSPHRFVLSVSFHCSPETAEKLKMASLEEIELIRRDGFLPADIAEYIVYLKSRVSELKRANIYWRMLLCAQYHLGNGLNDVLEMDTFNAGEAIDIASMNRFWNNILGLHHFSDFILYPAN